MNTQSHLKIKKGEISPYVLLPGDPARVNVVGMYLEDFRILSSNREFRCGLGFYKGRKITVCSTGIGCPSTAIAAEELINAGARYLIRVGTCGGAWRKDILNGSLVIPTASIRDEGTTSEYIPIGFPAMADISLVSALILSARQLQAKCFVGINRTHDAFYGSQNAIKKWGAYLRDDRWRNTDTPILTSEMECSALFIIASLRGVKAGAILAVNANPEPLKNRVWGKEIPVAAETDQKITEEITGLMINIALNAIVSLL